LSFLRQWLGKNRRTNAKERTNDKTSTDQTAYTSS
jgi:hypothetical protein